MSDLNLTPRVLLGVREHTEHDPVELVVDDESGRLCIQAKNECGNNVTLVDLLDLLAALSRTEAAQ